MNMWAPRVEGELGRNDKATGARPLRLKALRFSVHLALVYSLDTVGWLWNLAGTTRGVLMQEAPPRCRCEVCPRPRALSQRAEGATARATRWRSAVVLASQDRRTHLTTVARETRNRRATAAWGQLASTWATNSARVTGVKRALEWLMRGVRSLLGCVHHDSFSEAPHLSTTSMGTTPNALDRKTGHLWIRRHGRCRRQDCRLGQRKNRSAWPQ